MRAVLPSLIWITGMALSRSTVRETGVELPARSRATTRKPLLPSASGKEALKTPAGAGTGVPLTVTEARWASVAVPETTTEASFVRRPAAGEVRVSTGAMLSRTTVEVMTDELVARLTARTVRVLAPSTSGTPRAVNEPPLTVAVMPLTVTAAWLVDGAVDVDGAAWDEGAVRGRDHREAWGCGRCGSRRRCLG